MNCNLIENETVSLEMTKDEFIMFAGAMEKIDLAHFGGQNKECANGLSSLITHLESLDLEPQYLQKANKAYRKLTELMLLLSAENFIVNEVNQAAIPLATIFYTENINVEGELSC